MSSSGLDIEAPRQLSVMSALRKESPTVGFDFGNEANMILRPHS